MRRRDFLKGLRPGGSGRREGTGPPPPAARVLRIALRATARRAALAPGASGGPAGQQGGQPQGAAPGTDAAPSRPGAGTPAPGTRRQRNGEILAEDDHKDPASGHLFDCVDRQKITRMTGSQP
jgi:hypothetical protein